MTDRSDDAIRDDLATVLRGWLHETPMSRCSASSDTCDTWPLAYEIADLILPVVVARAVAAEARAEYEREERTRIEAELAAARRTWNLAHRNAIAERDEARARVAAVAKSCIATINSANYLAPMPLPAANETASIQAEYARAIVRLIEGVVCQHCGSLPDADGDHSCPCPHRDEDCPDHLGAALAAAPGDEPK